MSCSFLSLASLFGVRFPSFSLTFVNHVLLQIKSKNNPQREQGIEDLIVLFRGLKDSHMEAFIGLQDVEEYNGMSLWLHYAHYLRYTATCWTLPWATKGKIGFLTIRSPHLSDVAPHQSYSVEELGSKSDNSAPISVSSGSS